jgi:16S rRNA (guanine966-N2)-methyltransferase
MRIIAGRLGGRIFESPRGFVTHPMSDRVRGGLFNTLGDITDLSILDAFAGSGALGFEALSRGAGKVLALEIDTSAQRSIEQNAKSLGLRNTFKLVRSSAGGWLSTSSDKLTFDIVLCDPPYNDLQHNLITRLSERVSPKGLLVLSWPGKQEPPTLADFDIVRQKSYGDAQLIFYKRRTSRLSVQE